MLHTAQVKCTTYMPALYCLYSVLFVIMHTCSVQIISHKLLHATYMTMLTYTRNPEPSGSASPILVHLWCAPCHKNPEVISLS